MENYSVILFILAAMLILSALSDRIKIPYPVLLIIAGICVGFIPSIPQIDLDPEIIFLIFLPPLLYDSAFNISFSTLVTHKNTVGTLAVWLVFITAIGIACIAHYLIPGMTWPLAFVLGSILSATDAVAATSVTKGLGLSHHTTTILEGESLINDASALVAYRFAIAAVAGSAFVFWKASLEFLLLMAGGVVIGMTMGKLLSFILQRVRKDPMITISFTLLMPFITYLLAEELHVSGVIAVVVLGIGISRFSRQIFPERIKDQSKSIWDIIIFMLNGLIFILMGLEFPYVLKNIAAADVLPYIGYAFLITIGTLALRTARVFFQKVSLQRAFDGKRPRISKEALLDFENSLIISWAGMRGIVSLAVALALPRTLTAGQPFPMRDDIIFISVAVVLFTLIGQGLTLPLLVRRFKG
ncbi:MAG: Na+/H+ antiporter [Bacteroidota bacterium]